jgi:hypothetical protein
VSAGVWMVPVTLATLALLLWAAARLEGLLAPRASDTELSTLEPGPSEIAPSAPDPDSLRLNSNLPASRIALPGTGETSQSRTSD